ncbi:MAG: OsmC family protein [Trueperaceae bacterium]|nr:OsmC family protein [Trueperaceae bacterium]
MNDTATEHRNGVDVGRLKETIAHVQGDPSLARFRFRAATTWEEGAKSRTKIQGFYGAGREDDSRERPLELVGDEPPVLLGDNAGPNAVEAVLHALTSCLTVGFVYNAAAQGIEVRALDFDVEGELDLRAFLGVSDDARPGYQTIRVRYRVDADAPRAALEDLCAYVQRTSPVLDMLTKPVDVHVALEG